MTFRRRCVVGTLAAVLAAAAGGLVLQRPSHATGPSRSGQESVSATAADYFTTFYPLWFTYKQASAGTPNQLLGPNRMGPPFRAVVAPNDDTLYVSSFMDLRAEPLILTIPATEVTWSLLALDHFGTAFETGIPRGVGGTYALTGPGWTGELPTGVTRVEVPVDFPIFIIRADKYSAAGMHQLAEAEQFRASLRLSKLSAWQADPSSGAPRILPVAVLARSYKLAANGLVARKPLEFLRQLQEAVESPMTPPLSQEERALADRFNQLWENPSRRERERFAAAARRAHGAIVASYLQHKGSTNWVAYTNIADWGDAVLDRAATTEYLQLSNTRATAAYYHAFEDGDGRPLRGSNPHGYVVTFPVDQIPQAKRFWSLTVYTPTGIKLVRNPEDKYLVARYTPGLVTNPDGSISIYLARRQPTGAPKANWLPVPSSRFNVVLRVYGPEGSVADNTFVPPPVQRLRRGSG